MTSKVKHNKIDPEALETRFQRGMEHMTIIDKELANLINNFNDGQGSLAYLRFENPDTAESISTKGFSYGPAYTLVKEDNNKFILVKNVKNPQFALEDARMKEELAFEKEFDNINLQEEESLEAFQKRVTKPKKGDASKEKEMEIMKEEFEEVDDEKIFDRFGNINTPIRLYAAKNSFNKALENIINIANELRQMKVEFSTQ